MKSAKILLYAGGAANALFILFHLWLGWKIWHWTHVPQSLRALLEMFNLGSALFIGFLAWVSLRHPAELLASNLGRSICWLIVLLYGTRAAGELVFQPRVQAAILGTCLAVAALYLAALVLVPRRSISSVS